MLSEEGLNKIGYDVIGAAFAVRKQYGSSLLEGFYEGVMAIELVLRGHKVKCQEPLYAYHRGYPVKAHPYVADMLVDGEVIVELKALPYMRNEAPRQLLTYLTISNLRLGYLINFGAKDFSIGKLGEMPLKQGIYRFVSGI